MIRVNLLPIKEARQRSAGRMQLAVFAVLLIAELVGCGFLYYLKRQEVQQLKKKVRETRSEVQKLEERVEETQKYEKQAEKLEQKRKTLRKVQSQSIGPGPMLRELQVLLSKPRNPEQRYAQREKGWNVEWNPNHLWIKTLEETDKQFKLNGRALDADDVAEFLHRLETASHFHDVKLDYVRPAGKDSDQELVEFRVTGTITYGSKENQDEGSDSSGSNKKGSNGKGS